MLLRRTIAIPLIQRLELFKAIKYLNTQVYSATVIDYSLFEALPDSIFEQAMEALNVSMQQALPKLKVGMANTHQAKQQLLNSLISDSQLAKERHWNTQQALAHANSKAMWRVTKTFNNLTATHKQETYQHNNILFFQWQSMEDDKVRARHAHLDGMVFSYAQPPIANLHTGERFLPGQDWGCRCVDIPIIDEPS